MNESSLQEQIKKFRFHLTESLSASGEFGSDKEAEADCSVLFSESIYFILTNKPKNKIKNILNLQDRYNKIPTVRNLQEVMRIAIKAISKVRWYFARYPLFQLSHSYTLWIGQVFLLILTSVKAFEAILIKLLHQRGQMP